MDEREMMKDPNGPRNDCGPRTNPPGHYFDGKERNIKQMEDRRARANAAMPAGGYAAGLQGESLSPQTGGSLSTRGLIESKIDEHRGNIIRLRALLDLLPTNLGAISPLAEDAIRMMVLKL